MEGRVSQMVLRPSAARIFSNEGSPDLPWSFIGFFKNVFDKAVTILKIIVLVRYPLHSMLLSFRRKHEMFLISNGHSLDGIFCFKLKILTVRALQIIGYNQNKYMDTKSPRYLMPRIKYR